MSDSFTHAAMRSKNTGPRAGIYGPTLLPLLLIESQRLQCEALVAWQNTIAALGREMWASWVCRWGGGVPIDA